MSRRTILLVAVFGTALAAVAGTLAAQRNRTVTVQTIREPAPILLIESNRLNFGEAWETDQFVLELPVVNSSSEAVEVRDVRASCNCTVVDSRPSALSPGGSDVIRIRIDLRPQSPCEGGSSGTRKFATTLRATAVIGSKKQEHAWTVSGAVKQPVSLEPISFGRCSDLASPAERVVSFDTPPGVEELSVECRNLFFQAAVRPVPDRRGRFELTVKAAPNLKQGTYTASLTFAAKNQNNVMISRVAVPVSLDIVPDIEAVPERVLAGAREVGTEVSEPIAVRSLSGRAFAIEQVEATGSGISASVGPDQTCSVRIRFDVAGPLAGAVKLRVRTQGGDAILVEVSVHGHGIEVMR